MKDVISDSGVFYSSGNISPSPPMSQLDLFLDAALEDSPELRKRSKGEGTAFEFATRFREVLEEARSRLELAQQRQRASVKSAWRPASPSVSMYESSSCAERCEGRGV